MDEQNFDGCNVLGIEIGDMAISVFRSGHVQESVHKDYSDSHFHTAFEFQYIENGSITIADENEEHTANEGECIIIPPGTFHSNKKNHAFLRYTFSFSITSDKVGTDGFSEYCYYSRILNSIKGICIYRCSSVCENMKKIIKLGNVPLQSEHMLRLYTAELLTEFLQFVKQENKLIDKDETEQGLCKMTPEDERLKFIIENCIHKYFATDDTAERVAYALNMSSRNCARVIYRLFGENISDIVTRQRMKLARTLILKTKRQMNDIAEAIGYKTYVAFFTAFKKYYGMSPASLRDTK